VFSSYIKPCETEQYQQATFISTCRQHLFQPVAQDEEQRMQTMLTEYKEENFL